MRLAAKVLPEYDLVYLGDTARTPYGTRSAETIFEFTRQAINFLFGQNCALVIVACNTASAEALRKIQQEFLPGNFPDRRVLGVIIPSVEAVCEIVPQVKSIGILATEGTVASGAFAREIKEHLPQAQVVQTACPMFVPLVETGEEDASIITRYAERYCRPAAAAGAEAVILGCTHYEALVEFLRAQFPPETRIVAQSYPVAEKLKKYLSRHPEIERKLSKNSEREFFTTDLTERFRRLAPQFYGAPLQARTVKID